MEKFTWGKMATILKSTRPPFGKGPKLRMALRIMKKIVDIPIQEQKREGAVHSTSWLTRVMLLVSSYASSINKYLQTLISSAILKGCEVGNIEPRFCKVLIAH